MSNRRVKIDMPDLWHSVHGEKRTYTRDGDPTCRLQFKMFPPIEGIDEDEDGRKALNHLRMMAMKESSELGHELHHTQGKCPLGRWYTVLWRSPKKVLRQFWLIPCEVSVLAYYSTANMEAAQKELDEVQEIVQSIHAVDDE